MAKNQMQNFGPSEEINNSNYIPLPTQGNYDGKIVPLYDGIKPITQTQPQVAQLEIKYAGPLVKNSIVEKLEDLINPDKFPIILNYQHRRVWVKEYGCEYYLDNGDGTRLENWKRAIGRLVVHTWSSLENYQEGDMVNYFGKLYVAKQNISANSDSPLINENLWQVVTGEIETYSWHFKETNQIQIWTEIRNPRFEVCLGELSLDANNEIIYNPETGLPIYKHIEIVEACIRQGVLNFETGSFREYYDDGKGDETLDSDFEQGGVPYAIQLFTDEIITSDKTYYDIEKSTRPYFNVIVSIK